MKADRVAQAKKTMAVLRKLYPKARCELDFTTPLQLIVATILSAQCTDKRVNVITPILFKRYKTARDYAEADAAELESIIKSAGFYRSKGLSIREMAKALVERHGGEVPRAMDELLALRGVARKTGNVVLGSGFGIAAGVVVDTHMKRVAYRLGLTDEADPVKVERDLMACVPKKNWIFFSQGMVWHGRRICFARNPNCPACPMRTFCPKRGV